MGPPDDSSTSHNQDTEDDGGLSARISALSLGDEDEEEGGASLPRRVYLVQWDTAVDVRAGAAASAAAEGARDASTTSASARHDDDGDPWATVGGLERAIQEVVGCVEQVRPSCVLVHAHGRPSAAHSSTTPTRHWRRPRSSRNTG